MAQNHDPIKEYGVRITSDGWGRNTHIYLPDGTDIGPKCAGFRVEGKGSGPLRVFVEFLGAEMNIEPGAEAEAPELADFAPRRASDVQIPARVAIPTADSALRPGHFGL